MELANCRGFPHRNFTWILIGPWMRLDSLYIFLTPLVGGVMQFLTVFSPAQPTKASTLQGLFGHRFTCVATWVWERVWLRCALGILTSGGRANVRSSITVPFSEIRRCCRYFIGQFTIRVGRGILSTITVFTHEYIICFTCFEILPSEVPERPSSYAEWSSFIVSPSCRHV